MKIVSFTLTLIAFCFSFAFASNTKPTFSPFLSAGFSIGTDSISNFDFVYKSLSEYSSLNVFADIGFKVNMKSFFVAPRLQISSKNRDLKYELFLFNDELNFSSSSRLDFDLLLGTHYKQFSFYVLLGKGKINYEEQTLGRELKIRPLNFGLGFEYYTIKQLSLFVELTIYYADLDPFEEKISGVLYRIDTEFRGQRLKLGARFYPIG